MERPGTKRRRTKKNNEQRERLGIRGPQGVRRPERPGVHPSDGKGGERNPGLEPKSQGPARKEEGDRTGPRKEHTRGHMQRVARIKHRCKQHNRETSEKNKRHYVTLKREHMKCMMCAQTKPFDKVTIFLTQQCPAANQAHWELRIQQLKSEMDKEQQGQVAKDLRSLMGLQANTPRQKDRKQEETPRRVVKSATGSRKPNLGSTKREIEAAQKRQERLKKRAKLHNKGLTQERDLHWILVDEELLRCELCGKNKGSRQSHGHVPTAMHERETRRMVGNNLREIE